MHPQERDLIAQVFDRLAASSGVPKDAEADALIRERAHALPDPVYALVQAVCLQDVTLRQAQARIAELERQVAARPAAGGSFLGAAPANPWGGGGSVPPVPPQPQYQQQQPQYQQPQQYVQPSPWGMGGGMGGGGFLRGVAGTAMGVAGGTLLAEGISSLFSGHHSGFGGGFGGAGGAFAGEPERVVENVTVNNYYGDQSADDGSSSTDAGWQDDGSSGDFSGGDDSVDM